MRKRSVISVLLVLVILGLSHNAWLTIKPKSPVTVQTVQGGGGRALPAINSQSRKPVRPSVKFEALPFIIIAILGYLLSYKLTSYLADFKTEKKYSRIDIVFLAVCTVIMFLPMSHISDAEKSDAENRNLAVWKPLINKKGQINYNFGRDYDNWFSDRFGLRKELVTFYKRFRYLIETDHVKLGNWYGFKSNGFIFNYGSNLKPYSPEKLLLIKNNMEKLNKLCLENNIKLYVMILPLRESIYRDFDKIRYSNDLHEPATKALIDYLKKDSDINYIFPEEDFINFRKANDEMLFFKTDHHITDTGAYLLYKILIQNFKQKFPKLVLTPQKDFNISQSNLIRWEADRLYANGIEYERSLIKDDKMLHTQYPYFDYKYSEKIKVSGQHPHYEHYNKEGNYKLLIIGDSYQENLAYFLNTSFQTIDKYRLNHNDKTPLNIKYYKNIIQNSHADMLLILIHSPYSRFLCNIFP